MHKEYKTKRLVLRRLAKSDYAAWVFSHENYQKKQDKFDMNPLQISKRTRAVFNAAVARHAALAKRDRTYIWNVFLKKTGELVGWIDIGTVSRDPHQMANVGYFIINSYRHNGYAREAVQRIVKAAFKDLKFHRLEAVMDLDNRASILLAKKSGLQKEGIKKYYWFQNGRWEDQMVYIATPELLC